MIRHCIWLWCLLFTIEARSQWFDITSYGAIGDSTTDNTAAIQKAVDACAAKGGKVYFPAGKYLSATVYLKSNVTLYIAGGATILGQKDTKLYPHQQAGIRFYGDEWAQQALFFCKDQENVHIEGNGIIDGQGAAFVTNTLKKPDRYRNRPYLLWFIGCKNISVRDITLRNSAFWMQHYLDCDDVKIQDIRIWNHSNKNNDMMDIDGCRNVIISGINGDSDDDGITIKSTSPRISENITISNCVISSHCNALKFGTESTGGFRNIAVTNCVIRPSAQLITIYGKPAGNSGISLEMADGGIMENVSINNIVIDGPQVPLFIRLCNRGRKYKEGGATPAPGIIRNIHLSDIHATGADVTGCSITGIAGTPLQALSLSHITIETAGGGKASGQPVPELEKDYPEATMFGVLPAYGLFIRYAKDIRLSDITFRAKEKDSRPGLVISHTQQFACTDLDVAGISIQDSSNGFTQEKGAKKKLIE